MTATIAEFPTFIDLRAVAAQAGAAADPFGEGRQRLPLRESPVEAGTIVLAAGSEGAEVLTGDWWLISAEGEATLTCGETVVTLAANQSCVIGHGAPFRWSSQTGARLLFMRYVRGTGDERGLIPIRLDAERTPSGAPLAELLTTPTPSCRNFTDFRSADGEFTCGTWDSTPYTRTAMRYVHFELMVLLDGTVTFVDETGRTGTFDKGDIFMVEQQANCSWESLVDVAKIYAIYRPLA